MRRKGQERGWHSLLKWKWQASCFSKAPHVTFLASIQTRSFPLTLQRSLACLNFKSASEYQAGRAHYFPCLPSHSRLSLVTWKPRLYGLPCTARLYVPDSVQVPLLLLFHLLAPFLDAQVLNTCNTLHDSTASFSSCTHALIIFSLSWPCHHSLEACSWLG